MGRYATEETGTSFKQASAGNHVARCVQIVDLGTQHGEYQGEPNVRQQIIVRWELPFETIKTEKGEEPMLVSKFYTNSLSEKANLRKDLANWRTRDFNEAELKKFDLQSILGAPCMVSITHVKDKARVSGIGAMPKGSTCPPAHNPLKAFWMDVWDDNAFAALPEGFKRIIRESDEWRALNSQEAPPSEDQPQGSHIPDDIENDIPF